MEVFAVVGNLNLTCRRGIPGFGGGGSTRSWGFKVQLELRGETAERSLLLYYEVLIDRAELCIPILIIIIKKALSLSMMRSVELSS